MHILWERHKGEESFWRPFLGAWRYHEVISPGPVLLTKNAAELPTSFTTSLYWSDDELREAQSETFIGERV